MMKYLALAAVAPLLSGCWFVFIPGTVIGAASDAITGEKGNNCVSDRAKVGDRVRMRGGGWATIESISGPSSRCANVETPIRASLVFDSAQ